MAKPDIILDEDVIDILGRINVKPDESGADGIIRIFPGRGNIRLGGAGQHGDLVVQDTSGENRIHLDGSGNNAARGAGSDSPARVYADGRLATLRMGGKDAFGSHLLRGPPGAPRIQITAGAPIPDDSVNVYLNGDGEFMLRHTRGNLSFLFVDPEEKLIGVRDSDGSMAMNMSADGTLEVGDTIVVDDIDLLAKIQELEARIEELEGGS